jgi:pimeloyl-ACP methyl ester carboxylesterase
MAIGLPMMVTSRKLARDYGGDPSKLLTLPDGSIARYQDFAADGTGPEETLLLLHGGAVSLESWSEWIERLRGRRRIVAVDLPGHGLTGAMVANDYTTEGMVKFVESFVSALGLEPFVLVGHSMGGHVAWRFALRHPGLVRKLVLIAPGGLAEAAGPRANAVRIASLPGGPWIIRLAATRARLGQGLREVVFDASKVTDDTIDRLYAMSQRAGSFQAMIARLRAPDFEPSAIRGLGEIKSPILLLWGKQDVVFPVHLSQAFENAVASTELVTYENCGHFPHEELPDRTVKDLLAFLERDG